MVDQDGARDDVGRMAADRVRALADEFAELGAGGGTPGRELLADLASHGRQFADYLRDRAPDRVLADLDALVRDRPAVFLAAALAAGAAMGRLGAAPAGTAAEDPDLTVPVRPHPVARPVPPSPAGVPPVPTAAPPRPVPAPPMPVSAPPMPVSDPPMPVSGPPVPVSGAPVPVSAPPVPFSGPPLPFAGPPVPVSGPPVPVSVPPVPPGAGSPPGRAAARVPSAGPSTDAATVAMPHPAAAQPRPYRFAPNPYASETYTGDEPFEGDPYAAGEDPGDTPGPDPGPRGAGA